MFTRRDGLCMVVAALVGSSSGVAQQSGGRLAQSRFPLAARLYEPDGGRLRFALEDSAHVVIFEFVPGRGPRVVFPATPVGAALGPGWHLPPVSAAAPRGSAAPVSTFSNGGGVRFYYLVASRRPLGLNASVWDALALEKATGLLASRGSDPVAVTTALRTRVMRLPGPGDWTDAIMAINDALGPDPLGASGDAVVECPDGRRYTVPPSAGVFRCPR